MAVEYRVKFENGSVTVTQTAPAVAPRATQNGAPAPVVSSKHLGRSFPSRNGGIANPRVGQGGVGNESTDPGGVGNESTDPGGVGNESTDPGGVGNESTDPGGVGNESTDPGGRAARAPASAQGGVSSFFEMETQKESEWCWAAVSASVDHYYRPDSYITQCEIASDVIGEDCCPDPDPYNEPERLQDALTIVGRLGDTTGRLTFEELQSEINANRPVCVRIAWNGEGAHFVALSGYQEFSSGLRTVDVADPFYPDSTENFDLFPSTYHGGGSWTATFLTRQKKGDPNVI